jgi:hypothetical protein
MILRIGTTDIPIPKGAVKITYAINDVANPELREGAFTDSFELPKTADITHALGYPDNFNVFDDDYSPYRKIYCEIVDEGKPIVRGYAEIMASEKGYKLNVYGDNVDWFDFIKDRDLRDLDLSIWDHTYDVATMLASMTNTEGYVYPLIDYGTMGEPIESGDILPAVEYIISGTGTVTYNGIVYSIGNTFTGEFGEDKYNFTGSPKVYKNNVVVADLFPAAFVHTLVKQIFKEAGYKLLGNFPLYPLYKKLILPFNNKDFDVSNNKSVKAIITGTKTYTLPDGTSPSTLHYVDMTLDDTMTPPAYGSDVTNYDTVLGRYTADVHTFIEVIFCPIYSATAIYAGRTGPYVGNAVSRVRFAIDVNSTITSSGNVLASGHCMGSGVIELFPGDYVAVIAVQPYAAIYPNDVTLNLLPGSSVEFKDVSASIVGGRVRMVDTLPSLKQGELIAILFNQFQLVTYTNAYTKTAYIEFSSKIVHNITVADDWSDLLDLTDPPEIEFSVDGYGRKNYFRYSESEEETEVKEYNLENSIPFGDGLNIFNNENLEAAKDVVELPIAATILRKCFIGGGAYVYLPVITRGSDPRMLIYNGVTNLDQIGSLASLNYIDGPVTAIPWAYFDKPLLGTDLDGNRDSLSFGQPSGYSNLPLLTRFFPPVKSMVERPKVLFGMFRLKATHIATLDHMVPKYIDRYKSYFYLNSVNEYSGEHELTECELVKISLNATGETGRTIIVDVETGESYIITEGGDYILLEGGGRIPTEG